MYVDEAERFVTNTIPDILSQVRKYGLSMVIANQYLEQLPDDTLKGIMGNVGTKTVFEVSDDDARRLASEFAPGVERSALNKLGAYRIAVKTRHMGSNMDSFILATPPPPPRLDTYDKDVYRSAYRLATAQRYNFMSKQEIRDWQKKRYFSSGEDPDKPDEDMPFYDK